MIVCDINQISKIISFCNKEDNWQFTSYFLYSIYFCEYLAPTKNANLTISQVFFKQVENNIQSAPTQVYDV